jgi:hypothetical protein
MLTARKLVQKELQETESSLRGILRGFGLKVGKTTPVAFEGRIRELAAGHPNLEVITCPDRKWWRALAGGVKGKSSASTCWSSSTPRNHRAAHCGRCGGPQRA